MSTNNRARLLQLWQPNFIRGNPISKATSDRDLWNSLEPNRELPRELLNLPRDRNLLFTPEKIRTSEEILQQINTVQQKCS